MQGHYSHSISYSPQLHHLSGRPHIRPAPYFPTSLPPAGAHVMHFPTSLPPSAGARSVHDTLRIPMYPSFPATSERLPLPHLRERSISPTPIFSSASYLPPVGPQQPRPQWNRPNSELTTPSGLQVFGDVDISAKKAAKGSLNTDNTEERKGWRQYGPRAVSLKRLTDDGRNLGGDAATDGVGTEAGAKKIFLGIERKGKELTRQISGEMRKLAGGKEKAKKAEPKQSFVARMERKVPVEKEQDRTAGDGSSWRRNKRAHDNAEKNQLEGQDNNDAQINGLRKRFSIDIISGTERRSTPGSGPFFNRQNHRDASRIRIHSSRLSTEDNDELSVPVMTAAPPSSNLGQTALTSHLQQKPSKHLFGHLTPNRTPPHSETLNQGNTDLHSILLEEPPKNKRGDTFHPPLSQGNTHSRKAYPDTDLPKMTDIKTALPANNPEHDRNRFTVKTPTPSALDFWAEADSTLSSARTHPLSFYNKPEDTFWTHADQAIPLPPWKKEGPSLEEWLAGLPGVGDGASDSKIFEAETKLRKKKRPEVGVLRVVNASVEDEDVIFDEDGNEILVSSDADIILPSVVVDKTLLHADSMQGTPTSQEYLRSFRPGGLEVLQEASRETSLHTPTVIVGGNRIGKTLGVPTSQGKAEITVAEELRALLDLPLPTEKIYRPADLARDVGGRLDALEKHWEEQRLTVGTVLKRMLWIVDSMVVKERENVQKDVRAQEMGWVD